MPRPDAIASRTEPHFPVLTRLLWQALVLGALVALANTALPLAPGGTPLSGPLSFWLLAAPAAALLALHRRFLAAAWRAHLVRATPRRRQRFGREGSDHIFPSGFASTQAIPTGKCALTPVPPRLTPVFATPVTRPRPTNPAPPTASARAA